MVYASTRINTFSYLTTATFTGAADVGWITGHSYIVYGPLANARRDADFEGCRTTRIFRVGICDKHQVNIATPRQLLSAR